MDDVRRGESQGEARPTRAAAASFSGCAELRASAPGVPVSAGSGLALGVGRTIPRPTGQPRRGEARARTSPREPARQCGACWRPGRRKQNERTEAFFILQLAPRRRWLRHPRPLFTPSQASSPRGYEQAESGTPPPPARTRRPPLPRRTRGREAARAEPAPRFRTRAFGLRAPAPSSCPRSRPFHPCALISSHLLSLLAVASPVSDPNDSLTPASTDSRAPSPVRTARRPRR
nr:uncharacterized protein LOC116150459 [Camelus dromedarius]